jgi:hypothetical protein
MRSNPEHDWKRLDRNPATFLGCFYGHQTASTGSRNRPRHLRCASSIAAVDWDAHRVRLTTKTSRVERGRDERFAG